MGKTICSIVIMVIAAFIGLFLGASLGDVVGGMILLALIAGIGCIVYAIESLNQKE